MSEQNSNPILPEKRKYDQQLLARMIVREGKSFRESALAAGYAQSVADQGLKIFLRSSPRFAQVLQRASEGMMRLEQLKPLAIVRLHSEITNPKSPLGLKAIEIAGRFKETDWFVRNADVQIGIFNSIAEESPAEKAIEAYREDEK